MAKENERSPASQIRSLKAVHSYLTAGDIIRLTGHSPDVVREALRDDEADGPSK